ncbi:TIGR03943 family putative permease subunit [Cohnella hongkongensis]|uniref:TIGR03943 family putative permease subunit n=1 Tax=Cohnella hongkongensis TaxID=178337 RepID=A0ABV9F7A0_9BACL
MSKSAVLAFHYAARAIVLAGFAFLIVHLVRSGNLNLYIAERMQLIVKLSALGLYAVAAQQLYSAMRAFFDKEHDGPNCDCLHEMPATWGKSLLFYGWFAIPLVIGYAVPDGLLGSSMASAKGVQFAPHQTAVGSQTKTSLSASLPSASVQSPDPSADAPAPEPTSAVDAGKASPPPEPADEAGSVAERERTAPSGNLDELFPSDTFTESYAAFGKKLYRQDVIHVSPKQFIETLTTIDLYRDAFLGKTVEVSGFVYREDDMGPQQFGVSRFAVTCCSADASPYGLMAAFDEADKLATDEWISVTGTLGTTMYNGIEIIQIDVAETVKIPAPDDPYVSPDFDFGIEAFE